jgi:hypothetical protein
MQPIWAPETAPQVGPWSPAAFPSATTVARLPTRAVVLGRTAAVLSLASVPVHVLLLDPASLGSLVMGAAAALCVPCAWRLWRSPTGSVWVTTATLDTAMLVIHASMLADTTAHAHHSTGAGGLMWSGAALLVGQLLLAGAAALRR